MKKIVCFALLLAVSLCAFAQNGVIRELSGEVELKPAGTTGFVPAKQGDSVATDTIVSTGFRSTAIIEVGSSSIAIRPLTRLSLAEIQSTSGSETLNVNLQAGRIKVDVKPPAGTKANCTVQSPSATASVRGTSFEFDTVNLQVSEGTVALKGNVGIVMLIPAGGVSYVDSEGKVADPIETNQSSLTPSAPVGTGLASETPSSSTTQTSGNIDLNLVW